MSNPSGQSGMLTAVVTIIRKATGETETYNLTGTLSREQVEQIEQKIENQQEQPQ